MRYVVAIALLLSACAPTQPCETCPPVPARIAVDVCVDDAFDAGDRAAIDRAAARWTAALCGLVTVDTRTVEDGDTRGCTRSILRVESGYEWVTLKQPCDAYHCVAGWTNAARDTAWVIVDLVPIGAMEAVVAHELGHLLGADEGLQIMNPRLHDGCVDRRAAIQAAIGVAR